MANKLTDGLSKEIVILKYQAPIVKKFTQVVKYGLNDGNNGDLLDAVCKVEMYDWLNENNCCSKHIKCNFTHIQETIQFLKSLSLNIATNSCC
jgi:hypothetical protein